MLALWENPLACGLTQFGPPRNEALSPSLLVSSGRIDLSYQVLYLTISVPLLRTILTRRLGHSGAPPPPPRAPRADRSHPAPL